MVAEEQARVLVTVKAYPQPSRSHGETVCVAGVRVGDGAPRWIRLYPVAYRELEFADRFKKYQFIDLRVFRATTDLRPESFKPNIPSAVLGNVLRSDQGWRERWEYLRDLAGATTACELYGSQSEDVAPSLGLVKPAEIIDLEIEENDAFDADKKLLARLAAQGDLFKDARDPLEPAPYRLKYRYKCQSTGCNGHNQTLIDWEAGQAARSWRAGAGSEQRLREMLKEKFLDELCAPSRDTHFFLGNQHQHPRSFLVLGVFWPPNGSRPAPILFD